MELRDYQEKKLLSLEGDLPFRFSMATFAKSMVYWKRNYKYLGIARR